MLRGMVVVRRAEEGDIGALTRLRVEFLAESRRLSPGQLPEGFAQETEAFLRRHERAGTARSWLAEEADHCVGIVTLVVLDMPPHPLVAESSEGFVLNMYVPAAARRRGIGRQLMDACLEGAREMGIRKLMLYATPDGRPLYDALGFGPGPTFMDLRLSAPVTGP